MTLPESIDSIEALESLYGAKSVPSLRKVVNRLTPLYRKWIESSRFCILSTIGPEGTDGSPRGDDVPVVRVLDPGHLAMPDWRGNNRLDSLRNIVRDGRVSLMFMVPGSNTVVRVNGTAILTTDEDLRASFEKKGRVPATVIVVAIGEIYTQCAKALIRSGLWTSGDESGALPTTGQILAEVTAGEEGGADYDAAWPARAEKTMW